MYDPQQKTLLADKGEIRVGNKFQADITDLLKEGTSPLIVTHVVIDFFVSCWGICSSLAFLLNFCLSKTIHLYMFIIKSFHDL